jgi:hypothetical protein
MVSSILAAVCGVALSTQVRMCTVTLQQLTAPYHQRIERHLIPTIEHFGDNYLANGIAMGYNIGYRRQIDLGQRINYIEADARVTLGQSYVGTQLSWRW